MPAAVDPVEPSDDVDPDESGPVESLPPDEVVPDEPLTPDSGAATTVLATSRFRSHSHGPGSVSSKSLMSKISRRSGVPKTPKFVRCASPQIWAVMPETGVPARSAAMMSAAPR